MKILMVAQEIGTILGTRTTAKKMMEVIKQEEYTHLNFTKVQTVSRSFAHQLIKQLREYDTEVAFMGQDKHIKEIFKSIETNERRDVLKDDKIKTLDLNPFLKN